MSTSPPPIRASDVVLRDGSTVHLRPVQPADEAHILALFESLSLDSRQLRFFSPAVDLAGSAAQAARVDNLRHFGLLALTTETRVVAHAEYVAIDAERAEIAFAVEDSFQGRGLATIMLGQLAQAAEVNGIGLFVAEVLRGNARMLDLFQTSGFPVEVRVGPDEVEVLLPTSLDEAGRQRFEQRERLAAQTAPGAFLAPRSVAVVGASRRRGTVGGEIFHNLLAEPFNGPVYPVNPSARVVQCVPAYPTIEAIPGPVDLAIVAVPASQVLEVAEQAGRKGVRALLVISAGFGESGPEGRARQEALVALCRAHGMRMIGPNSIGIANSDPDVRLHATFGPLAPPPGSVGLLSQSGALGLAATEYAAARGLGLSSTVSVGNKADISGNDLLNYWETDPRTSVILLYLESFGNPRKFSRIARRVGREKPIVAVKSGRSSAGARATASHTGALLAASDVSVEALFRQSGVIRTDTLEELFDVTTVLANQPLPRGPKVAIVTNVGGPAILCADACEAQGLEVPLLGEQTRAGLRAILPPEASVGNPVDMIASATAEQYRQAIEIVARDPSVDAIVSIFIQPLDTRAEEVATALVAASRQIRPGLPLLAVFMSASGPPDSLLQACLPTFRFPEPAAIALAHAARYAEWRQRPPEEAGRPTGIRRQAAAAIVARVLGRGGGWLEPTEVADLLACYGLPYVQQRLVGQPAEAGRAAAEIGGRVALKAVAPGLVHKTEVGAVLLGLDGSESVVHAAEQMRARLAAGGLAPSGFLVQAMAPSGVELMVGVVQDPRFGPLVACGAGGVLVELLKDVAVRLTPLSQRDAEEMPRELRTFPRLTGYRGSEPVNLAALTDLLLRIGALADDLPHVAELDCNPVVALPSGALIVDARVRVEAAELPPPLGARR
jgi:acetyl coenzyme A synthetase (ADP forming)-like protein